MKGIGKEKKVIDKDENTISWDVLHSLMDDLKAMARKLLSHERNAQSVKTTGLVVTALRRQKLADQDWSEVKWEDRKYFFGAMNQAMKRALKDYARKRTAKKRAEMKCVSIDDLVLDNIEIAVEEHPEQIEALDEAVASLRSKYPKLADVVEHRFYSGLTIEQTADVMDVGEKTIRRWWQKARLLLYDEVLRILNRE